MTSSAKYVASPLELMAEFGMIENFASGGEDDLTIFVRERLAATTNIHDAQSDVSEPDLPAEIESIAIGSPVPDRRCHASQRIKGHSGRLVPRNPRYAAHWIYPVEVVRNAR